jgi:hypothetical protein
MVVLSLPKFLAFRLLPLPTRPSLPHLKPVVGPAAKLHDAGLLVEGKVLDVHLARRVVDRGRLPLHLARGHQGCLRRKGHLKVAVGAEMKEIKVRFRG